MVERYTQMRRNDRRICEHDNSQKYAAMAAEVVPGAVGPIACEASPFPLHRPSSSLLACTERAKGVSNWWYGRAVVLKGRRSSLTWQLREFRKPHKCRYRLFMSVLVMIRLLMWRWLHWIRLQALCSLIYRHLLMHSEACDGEHVCCFSISNFLSQWQTVIYSLFLISL
jgi:hypothetical protein